MNISVTSRSIRIAAAVLAVATAGAVLAGCSSTPSSPTKTSSAAAVALPKAFKGKSLVAPAVNGYPPYAFVKDGKNVGISNDLATAIGVPWGTTITLKPDSFENALLGVDRGTYFATFGADVTADREKTYDQVPFLADHYEFMSLKGNSIGSATTDLCGLKISVVAADSAIPVLQADSKACTAAGDKAITVLTFADQASATLAVSSKQADATTSTLTNLGYISKQAPGQFELGGPKYQYVLIGIAVKKGTGLAQSLADAINVLIKNGKYAAILKTYGVQEDAITNATVNPDPNIAG